MRLPSLFKSDSFRLFLISFLILFLELACIRWLSSYVLYLGYFTNFVLLGCLLGIGAGALLAHKSTRLIKWLPILMFVFFTTILFTRSQVTPHFEYLIYFTSNINPLQLPAYVLLPLIFISITAIFTSLSQDLGVLLTQFPPLKAYNLNILGSLAGIASFTLISALSLPSWVWMLVAAILLIPLLPRGRSFGNNLFLLSGVVLIFTASDYAYANIWSPYYRLDLIEVKENIAHRFWPSQNSDRPEHILLLANGIAHQEFATVEQGPPYYQLPYTAFTQKPIFQNVLVVGAGGGNDVAFALANGVQHVDAVEIDPRIAALGEKYHPENPYGDPRVTLYVDDARSFLEKTDAKYDLVIFALPDSLVLAATTSNLRLESYLFTLESFQSVKEHLKPDGLFVLYNFYRYDWLIDKINDMLYTVFGEPPVYHRYSELHLASFATLFAGPKAIEVDLSQPGFAQASQKGFTPATDNWPFLYIKEPSLPAFYSGTLLILLFFSAIYIRTISPKGAISQHGLPFFFMGAAFTLLEVKSIVQFLLLFGSTWLVNSLVFFAVLLVVLIANWLAARYKFTRVWILYVFLFLALTANFIIPLKTFLLENLTFRYILATIFLFSPIFFANLIYSTTFRDTKQANVAFGVNLLGTVMGGAAEYLSLYTGYQGLIILAGLFYFCAFYFFRRMRLKSSPG
jgi:spermidine synthase